MYIRCAQHVVKSPNLTCLNLTKVRYASTKKCKRLRILFCGSDEFSCASLRALYVERQRDREGIASIDVLCRPGKPSGRSLKTIREVPIKAAAQELGLTIHERDTFTGWDLPRPHNRPINLIIAVSFGLFVPPRILKSAEYGGLNVHPSLLPNFRGPAPLQHMIMSGSKVTGVTLQTLDEKSFDHGIVLAQTPKNGLPIPKGYECTYSDLLEFITPKAAEILVQGIRDRIFLPPLSDAGWYTPKYLQHAPKITPADRQIDWREWRAIHIERRYRALDRLWNNIYIEIDKFQRCIFEDIEVVPTPHVILDWLENVHANSSGDIQEDYGKLPEGQKKEEGLLEEEGEEEQGLLERGGGEGEEYENGPVRFIVYKSPQDEPRPQLYINDGDAIIIAARGGESIRVKQMTIEGQSKKAASKVMQSIEERNIWQLKREGVKGLKVEPRGPKIRKIEPNKLLRKIASGPWYT